MNRDPAGWRRLAELLRVHRSRLGWTQTELAERAGVSTKSVVTAESGSVPTRMPPTLSRITDALGWADGAIDAVLDGRGTGATTWDREPDVTGTPGVRATPRDTSAGQAVSALRGAVEFSRVCEQMGADRGLVAQFDAIAEALLSSAVSTQARQAGLTQDHFAAVAHSPRGDGGPETDRKIVDDVVRRFDEEQIKE